MKFSDRWRALLWMGDGLSLRGYTMAALLTRGCTPGAYTVLLQAEFAEHDNFILCLCDDSP